MGTRVSLDDRHGYVLHKDLRCEIRARTVWESGRHRVACCCPYDFASRSLQYQMLDYVRSYPTELLGCCRCALAYMIPHCDPRHFSAGAARIYPESWADHRLSRWTGRYTVTTPSSALPVITLHHLDPSNRLLKSVVSGRPLPVAASPSD